MLRCYRALAANTRAFATSTIHLEKALPPRPKILETDLIESFLRGSGSGGQKINKTSSAVQLKHIPTGIVVKSQDTRSREQNRRNARDLLAEKLDGIEKGPNSRMAIKEGRVKVKKASKDKKSRRKYRKLEEEKSLGDAVVRDDISGVNSPVMEAEGASHSTEASGADEQLKRP